MHRGKRAVTVRRQPQDLFVRVAAIVERPRAEAAVQDPCVRLSVQGVYRRSPQKIFVRDLKVRSLFKLSINDLRARPLLSSPGLCTRSP